METNQPNPTNILVVEDDPSIATVIEEILTGKDYQVRVATNPGEAFEAVKALVPELVLMDVNLSSDIDGIETMKRLRDDHEDLPVCFVTAFSDDETVKRAEQLGPMAYLVKPFEMADVLTMVNISLATTRRTRERMRAMMTAMEERVVAARAAPAAAKPKAEPAASPSQTAEVLEDKLTGLPNRRAVEKLIADQETDPQFFAGLLSMDHMPLLRQRFGGAAVDQILFSYSQHLGQHLPEYCLLGRWDAVTFIVTPKEPGTEAGRELARIVSLPMIYHLRLPGRSALLRVSSSLRVVKADGETPLLDKIAALLGHPPH